MLVNATNMLLKARDGHYAVGQFNINNLEWTKSILLTAQEMNSPVILGVSEGAGKYMTGFKTVAAMVKAMEEKGYEILSDDLAMVPMTTTRLTDPDQLKAMGKLLDALEDNDDVQNVWHSLENEEDLPE